MTVHVANGEYCIESGERFPLSITDSISLVGEDWTETRIQGGLDAGDSADAVIVITGTDCVFRRFSVCGDTISNEITDINNIVESNARSVEEIATASEHLSSMTEKLNLSMEKFKV